MYKDALILPLLFQGKAVPATGQPSVFFFMYGARPAKAPAQCRPLKE
jgi:hypothetical protein